MMKPTLASLIETFWWHRLTPLQRALLDAWEAIPHQPFVLRPVRRGVAVSMEIHEEADDE